jgi:hypothetical protein
MRKVRVRQEGRKKGVGKVRLVGYGKEMRSLAVVVVGRCGGGL